MKTFGWFGIGAIGFAALLGSAAGARAGDFSVSVGIGGGHYGHCYGPRYHGPYRHYGYRPYYYHRPGPVIYGGSRVVVVPSTTRVVTADRGYSQWEIVRDVQLELRRRGFYNGEIDGIFGPRTRDGLMAYQSRRGIPVTGAIDRDTLRALGLD